MQATISSNDRTLGGLLHGSTFCKFFIPFGNFIIPFVIWYSHKDKSDYLNHHGKEVLNFQISLWIYGILLTALCAVLGLVFFPTVLIDLFSGFDLSMNWGSGWPFGFVIPLGILGLLYVCLGLFNIFLTILATIKGLEGQWYKYPFTIRLIK